MRVTYMCLTVHCPTDFGLGVAPENSINQWTQSRVGDEHLFGSISTSLISRTAATWQSFANQYCAGWLLLVEALAESGSKKNYWMAPHGGFLT